MRHRAGTTFVELTLVLALLGILLGIVTPATQRWRDVLAVRAARDELAAGIAGARATAAAVGGAALILDRGSGIFWVATPAGAGPATDLRARYGVHIEGPGGIVELQYDGLGIGRLANRSIRLRRGRAEAGVVISAYGRVRRW